MVIHLLSRWIQPDGVERELRSDNRSTVFQRPHDLVVETGCRVGILEQIALWKRVIIAVHLTSTNNRQCGTHQIKDRLFIIHGYSPPFPVDWRHYANCDPDEEKTDPLSWPL